MPLSSCDMMTLVSPIRGLAVAMPRGETCRRIEGMFLSIWVSVDQAGCGERVSSVRERETQEVESRAECRGMREREEERESEKGGRAGR